jgi:hypothetical protein
MGSSPQGTRNWNVRSFLACKERGCTDSWQEAEWKRKVRKQVCAVAVMGDIEGGREASCKSGVCRVWDKQRGAKESSQELEADRIESRGMVPVLTLIPNSQFTHWQGPLAGL